MKHEIILERPWEAGTVASIQMETAAHLTSSVTALEALRRALTEWRDKTSEGSIAWSASVANFNAGDLSHYTVPGSVLKKHGILALHVECNVVDLNPGGWEFDTVLMEPEED